MASPNSRNNIPIHIIQAAKECACEKKERIPKRHGPIWIQKMETIEVQENPRLTTWDPVLRQGHADAHPSSSFGINICAGSVLRLAMRTGGARSHQWHQDLISGISSRDSIVLLVTRYKLFLEMRNHFLDTLKSEKSSSLWAKQSENFSKTMQNLSKTLQKKRSVHGKGKDSPLKNKISTQRKVR